MRQIQLAKRQYFTVVDDDDFDRVSKHCWSLVRGGGKRSRCYAHASMKIEGMWKSVYLHRFLISVPPGFEVDHRDNDGLNNRRENLRIATRSQNQQNKTSPLGSSRFKGVSWHKGGNKWVANIKKAGVRRYLGIFEDEIEAAMAYDVAAASMFGEFALLNFPKLELVGSS